MEKKKILLVLGIFIAIISVIGISYAYWRATLKQNVQNEVTSSCFEFEFLEKNEILLEKAYPINDEDGILLTPYEFTVRNICESATNYQVNLDILDTTTFEDLSYIKVMIDDNVSSLTNNPIAIKTLDDASMSYKLKTGFIDKNQEKTFTLRLWMDKDTPTDKAYMNKSLFSKIVITTGYVENLDNEIKVTPVSQSETYGSSETFQINVESKKFDIIAMSEDNENWDKLENIGKNITIEKTYNKSGTYKLYFKDELEHIGEVTIETTKIDDKSPVPSLKLSIFNDTTIKMDASGSKDNETSVVKYYYSLDGENWSESEESMNNVTDPKITYGIATEAIQSIPTVKGYLKVEDELGNISEVVTATVTRSTSTSLANDGTIDNNLRFIGASPNNYVSFNNELWQIIGVMNNVLNEEGDSNPRVKIIRAESIGNHAWDTNDRNNWNNASLNSILNETYFNSLNTPAKSMVDTVVWNLGGEANPGIASYCYTAERGKKVYSGNPTQWIGKIGLFYASDYGFAVGGSVRSTCINKSLDSWDAWDNCAPNDWLAPNTSVYTMTPNSGHNIQVWHIANNRLYAGAHINGTKATKPVLYLKPTVKIISGIGTTDSPFQLEG